MNYFEFAISLLAFAVTLFLLLEFIVSCDTTTWKAGLSFSIMGLLVICTFFLTKQHVMIKCPQCSGKISPARHSISNMIKISK